MYNKLARINVYNKTDEEYRQIQQEINDDMMKNNIKYYNSSYGHFEEFRGHWGNYCLANIPYVKAIEYAEKYNLDVDLIQNIITTDDIKALKVGDKVRYTTYGLFGAAMSKGTVYDISDNIITIRLYRKRNKGHILKVGEIGEIKKGWDVYTETYKELEVI